MYCNLQNLNYDNVLKFQNHKMILIIDHIKIEMIHFKFFKYNSKVKLLLTDNLRLSFSLLFIYYYYYKIKFGCIFKI